MEPPPPAELMEELIEEALLCIPPEDPTHLLHAALPRLLAMVPPHLRPPLPPQVPRVPPHSAYAGLPNQPLRLRRRRNLCRPLRPHNLLRAALRRFSRLASARFPPWPRPLPQLIQGSPPYDHSLCVWDPIADERLELPKLPQDSYPYEQGLTGAVLCAAGSGCNHLDCNLPRGRCGNFRQGDTCMESTRVLKYDVTTGEMNVIHLPPTTITHPRNMVLMATEDGNLGFARVEEFRLHLWSREAGRITEVGWERIRVIEFKTLLPVDARSSSPYVVGFVDGTQVIFLRMDWDLFRIDLKSGQMTKVHEGCDLPDIFIPYMSFYTPALGAVFTGVEPRASASSA